MALLGFSCGIPFVLINSTLQAWLLSEGIDITLIGLVSLTSVPYSLKFLWAPALDRYSLRFLGRRRGWMFVSQALILFGIMIMSFCDPKFSTKPVIFFAVAVAIFGATQDIVVDAYRRELLKIEEFGASFGLFSAGYRIAMITASALALILADHLPWRSVYFLFSFFMLVGLIATWFAPEPKDTPTAPRNLKDAVIKPFSEFFRRRGAIETLVFLVLYKIDAMMTVALTTPFFLSLGFSKTEVGAVTKGFGIFATLVGSLVGGEVISRTSIQRSLWIFGVTQALAALSYYAAASHGHNFTFMVIAIAVENFFAGTAIAAFSAFMMALCNKRYSATQLALLSSFMSLTRNFAGAPSGFLVAALGWKGYYLLCIFIGIPGLLLLTRFPRWSLAVEDSSHA